MDGDETDIDCGGSCGATCVDGEMCTVSSDCVSMMCAGGLCSSEPACTNGILDDGETDIDCGGACGATCLEGDDCFSDGDCVSGFCDDNSNTCQQPACDDGVQNGDETDVDCGGACGSSCVVGESCVIDDDCETMLCESSVCAAPDDCSNGLQDDPETDVDCGGLCGPTCMNGQTCNDGDDCVSNLCHPQDNVCVAPSCNDGVQDESDVDCGGACGPTCEDGDHCLVNGDCVSDACSDDEECVAPACLPDAMDNGCKSCILTSCCDNVMQCSQDVDCACWLDCVENTSNFDSCKSDCNINGNPYQVVSCANSSCNTMGACGAP